MVKPDKPKDANARALCSRHHDGRAVAVAATVACPGLGARGSLHLSPELVVYIAQHFCDIGARVALSATARKFRDLLFPLLFRGLSLYPARSDAQLLRYTNQLAQRLARFVERISFRDHRPQYNSVGGAELTDTDDDDDERSKTGRTCSPTRDTVYAAVIASCTNLDAVRLTLEHTACFPQSMRILRLNSAIHEFIIAPIRHPERVARVTLPRDVPAVWRALTRLRLSDMTGSTLVYKDVAQLSQLSVLEIDACTHFGEWTEVPYVCPLRRILLRRCSNFTGQQLATFLRNFTPTLESITMQFCAVLEPMFDGEPPPFRRLAYVSLSCVPFCASLVRLFAYACGILDMRLGPVRPPGATIDGYAFVADPQTGRPRPLGNTPAVFCAALPGLMREGIVPFIRTLRIMIFPWHAQHQTYKALRAGLSQYTQEKGIELQWW